ncbi:hypothetical protein SEA_CHARGERPOWER_1 [Mycobacterium phage Chargerpower]|nr:hypothetical protein SEA_CHARGERPOWER_1 [Mycobacterium phage Chargerpower]
MPDQREPAFKGRYLERAPRWRSFDDRFSGLFGAFRPLIIYIRVTLTSNHRCGDRHVGKHTVDAGVSTSMKIIAAAIAAILQRFDPFDLELHLPPDEDWLS